MKDYKHLAEMIYKRKSVREYLKNPAEILENNIDLIKFFDIQPLIENINIKVKVLRKAEVNNKRSDYCIAFYSEKKPNYLENIGFIGQQIELELQGKGLGTCWWGMKMPKKNHKNINDLNCIITMTAGIPKSPETRIYPEGFKRKTVRDIIIGDTIPDNLIEAIRIAPSAINLQPWLLEKNNNMYNFYIKPPETIMEKMIKKMRHIDMGIAMAHLFVQAKANGSKITFGFEGKDTEQGKYIGTIIVE